MVARSFLVAFVTSLWVVSLQAGPAAQAAAPGAAPPAVQPPSVPVETPLEVRAETPVAPAVKGPQGRSQELTIGQAFLLKMKQGGWTMVFLLLSSIAGVGFALERLVNLRSAVIAPKGLAETADGLWRAGKWEEIESLPEKSNSTLARIVAVIAKHRHSTMADVSTMAGDVASRDMRRHMQKAYPLAVVATISPLLGLFGTVIGMIGAFDKVAVAGSLGDASLLGGDISKALITTAAGLTIAIPALSLYHYFKHRLSLYALMLEEETGELINSWYAAKADGKEPGREGGDEG
jgi:biopolymer transport protein ExbB